MQLSWRDSGNPLPSGVRKEATYHEPHDAVLHVPGEKVHLLLQPDYCDFHVFVGAEKVSRRLITRSRAREEGLNDIEEARAELCRSWSTEQRKHMCLGPCPSWAGPRCKEPDLSAGDSSLFIDGRGREVWCCAKPLARGCSVDTFWAAASFLWLARLSLPGLGWGKAPLVLSVGVLSRVLITGAADLICDAVSGLEEAMG